MCFKSFKSGGFSTVYRANWKSRNEVVVLKSLDDLNEENLNKNLDNILNEWDCHEKCERPEIIENTPQCYVDLMKKCWNEDPSKRPSASEVENIIRNWIYRPSRNEINEELKDNIMEFIKAPIFYNKLADEQHPQACYTSRLHDFTSNELNEILESECLDDCLVNDIELLDIRIDEN
ncbi:kinase-like domain-containing protein [Rhizophagus clarus]|uniref:Kinase-like domain-containing protein n=1 Tax=Rhizophagus clarus TaxID=94130 RepID=A0A8H3M3M4_9GLOM|nr:kinase-like domain-containing protein [Rhizophagus clarus]